MTHGQFELPLIYQIIAVFLLAVTGSMVAIEKKYDFSGLLIMSFIAGASSAIIRDGIFLNNIPIIIKQWWYLVAIILAPVLTAILMPYIRKYLTVFVAIDALGLGIFGIIAAQMTLDQNLSILSAIFVGLIGAISGGFLRDIVTKSKPLLLKPGQYYFTAALFGIILFILLTVYIKIDAQIAAIIGILTTFIIRMLSYFLNWHTTPAENISKKILSNINNKNISQ
jgi:uncharacterized membrane protein YeiH